MWNHFHFLVTIWFSSFSCVVYLSFDWGFCLWPETWEKDFKTWENYVTHRSEASLNEYTQLKSFGKKVNLRHRSWCDTAWGRVILFWKRSSEKRALLGVKRIFMFKLWRKKRKKSEKISFLLKKSVQSKIWIHQENKINVFLLSKYLQNSGDIYLTWCKYNPD